MTNEAISTVKNCFDNSKDGEFNYGIILSDETRLFYRGYELNPMPKKGDTIKYKIINTKTSGQGNPYSNVSKSFGQFSVKNIFEKRFQAKCFQKWQF